MGRTGDAYQANDGLASLLEQCAQSRIVAPDEARNLEQMQARTAARRIAADRDELRLQTDFLDQCLKLGATQIGAHFENVERRVGACGVLLERADRIGTRL